MNDLKRKQIGPKRALGSCTRISKQKHSLGSEQVGMQTTVDGSDNRLLNIVIVLIVVFIVILILYILSK